MDEKAISSDLIRGHIDTIILHTLLDGDKYAQQISQTVENKSDNKYELNQATLYSSLKRLENLKHVKAYWHDSENGRRRFFSITELGKSVIETNLNSWSFSKEIIDKLTDQYAPVDLSSKILNVNRAPIIINSVQNVETTADFEKELKLEPVQKIITKPEKDQVTTNDSILNSVNEKEVNYKNILSGLIPIKETKKEVKPVRENVEPLAKDQTKEAEVAQDSANNQKIDFLDTIISENSSTSKKSYNSKIDFSDIVEKAENKGIIVRISSKNNENSIVKGNIFINKIKLFASLIVFFLSLVEFLGIILGYKDLFVLPFYAVILVVLALAIFPIVCIKQYSSNPSKTKRKLKVDLIYTVAIIVFNLILITFAVDLLFSIDLTVRGNLFYGFILPTIIYLDVFAYFLTKYLLSKKASFIVKNTQK